MHGIDYIALYLSVAFMCMALEFMMALKMNTNVVSTAEVVIFRRLTTFSITEILTQCLWLIDSAPRFQFPRPVQYGYNLIDLICTGLICYFWYRFIDMNLTPRENLLHRRKIETVFRNIPIITLVTVDCMSLLNHKVFYVSAAGNYIRGPWYFIQVACCFALQPDRHHHADQKPDQTHAEPQNFPRVFRIHDLPVAWRHSTGHAPRSDSHRGHIFRPWHVSHVQRAAEPADQH